MSRISRISLVAALIVVFAASAFAGAQKRRSVQHPSTPVTILSVKGTVVDDATGQPVKAVDVTVGGTTIQTDAAGRFELVFKSAAAVSFSFARSGYVTKSVTLTPGTDTTIRLTPTATVRVKMTNGTEYLVDGESVRFSFLSTMSGYPLSDNPRFCRNGQDWQPERATLAKIQGPATAVTDAACCDRGPILQVKVTLKNGEQSDAKFTDNCFGYEPIFVGREHVSAEFQYLRFTEIAEVVFP